MRFNSIDFAFFLPIVFAAYWIVGSSRLRLQNYVLLVASYVFYGWWDWRFLGLILFSTGLDYAVGLSLDRCGSPKTRRWLLTLSLMGNLGLLGVFKYYGFFVESFQNAFQLFGVELRGPVVSILLPVGISFYTFQTLSYTIDVYRRNVRATGDFVAFATFVSFFPQLVAGPIERAQHLIPQFLEKRKFDRDQAVCGMQQILWGLLKKIVIADNCARHVQPIFENAGQESSSTLILGAVLFAFQIYGDFSGYSDIAIGSARLFGFRLMQNFAYPYFSRDVAEFWRRWHISLSTWFRDYVYFPLGGSRGSRGRSLFNLYVVFLVSGFWHGASWNFILWGLFHAVCITPLVCFRRNRRHLDVVAGRGFVPSFNEIGGMALTFCLVCLGWVLFRAENLSAALDYYAGMLDFANFRPIHWGLGGMRAKPLDLS